MIDVLLADDHTLFREGVKLLLENTDEVKVVGEAGDGEEVLALAGKLRPHVVIMDIGMPKTNGLDATRRLRAAYPDVQVLILTMHESDDYFFQAIEAGASGYVLKEAAGADLLVAIRAVVRGGVFIYPLIARSVVKNFMERVAGGEERATYERLTRREKQVLALIADGLTNQEIARQLTLTVNTVQTHRSHIMDKLDLHSRAQLMGYAIRLGHLHSPSA